MIEFQVAITPDPVNIAKAFMNYNMMTFLRAEVTRLAASVERFAKQLTPVDKGRLRASIHFSPPDFRMQSVVSTNTDYAVFVHEGTKFMRGRPFLKYGAAFAQVALARDVNVRLEKDFTDKFKYAGFK